MAYLQKGAEPPTIGKGSKLSPKMSIFVDEYMVDFNATKAVTRAGYKTKYPEKMATELMRHPLVRKEVDERLAQKRERTEFNADYVITKLINIVENTEQGNPNAALRGLELLGKHLGLYKDKQEISGPDGGAIELEKKEIERNVSDFTSKLARLAARNGAEGVVKFPDREGNCGT